GVVQSADGRPTEQSYDVDKVLAVELNKDLAKLRATINASLPRINTMLKAAGLKQIESKGPIA
ncbi:MAG TPA: hypothetical protein VGH04_14600, partial [Gemmatimonadaceae bacterium]